VNNSTNEIVLRFEDCVVHAQTDAPSTARRIKPTDSY